MHYDKAGWLSGARRKPLGKQTEPLIEDKVMCFHIIVGSAEAGYAVFSPQGYIGDESHFIVCGPRDKSAGHKDGELWQLQDIHHQADAQFAGNEYCISVETSGMHNEPWSSAMLETLIDLTVVTCRDEKLPCKLVPRTGPVGKGLGYHELREEWNTDHHVCPGVIREGQLRTIVIPKARTRLDKHSYSPPKPKQHPAHHADGKIDVDGVMGAETIGAIQHVLKDKLRLGDKFKVDGIFGPGTRQALKRYLAHLGFHNINTHDAVLGDTTVSALRSYLGMEQGTMWTRAVTREIQRELNDNQF